MEKHGINSATLIVHSVKSRDSITWSQDSTDSGHREIIMMRKAISSSIYKLHKPGGARSEAWNRVSMIAPVKKFGRARLSTDFR